MNTPGPAPVPAPDTAELLRRRAAALARPPAVDPLLGDAMQVLRFTLGEQACLLELQCLREVQPLRDLLFLPMARPSLLGLVHWRGRMLPVLDLAAMLALPDAKPRHLLVVGRGQPALALAVGLIDGVQALSPQEVEHRAQLLEGLRPELVRGVTREGDLFLDGSGLLALQDDAKPAPPRHPEQHRPQPP